MLRGEPRRPHSHSHSRQRAPSPPTPSRRASGTVASASPESKEPAALEAPVVSSVEETSFTFEFKRGFKRAKKAMPPPVDVPIGEDNSREGLSNKSSAVPAKKDAPKQVEFTHCSPGIVARLMGLDTVPRPKKPLDRCQSDTRANLQRHLSGVVRDVDTASSGDQTCNLSSDELPALKDVFEVTEMENMAMHEQLQPGNQEPYLTNIEADLEFVRQKFLDAKRLATGEGSMNSKEFSEALEVLHSKRDVFLEILQENRTAVSGFSGHILSHSGLQCSSHASNAAAAQSFEKEIPCRMEGDPMEGGCDGMHDIPKEFEKPIPSMPLRETSVTPVAPLAPNEGKSKGSCRRSQIVVLKPNLQRKSFTPVLSSQEAPQYKQRSGTQHSKPPHHSKVTEMENMAMHEQLQPGNQEPYLTNIEVDLEFVRQKFLDAKRLATSEGSMNSKEFSEALEVLHSKRDVFLEILQENRTAVSGFSGHILSHSGLQCSSHASNAAAAQSFEKEIPCRMEGDPMEGGCDGMHDIPKEFEKPIPSMPLRETSVTPVAPLAPNEGKSKGSCRRSQIVVLKPNLQRKSFTPVLLSQEAPKYKQRSGTQHSKPPHHSKQFSVPRNNEVLEGERGSALQKVRKQTHKSGSRRRPSQEEYNLEVDTEKAKVSSTSYDDTMPFYSSIHSAGPSVSRKARKHLLERWQMACQSGSESSIPKGIKTLGEMLGLSRETSHRGGSNPNFNPYNVREVPGSPLGISSKDGWKTGIYSEDDSGAGVSRNFPRSKSLPASSTTSAKLSGRRQSAPTRRLPILKDILNAPTDESETAHIRKRSPIRNAKQKNGKSTVHLGKDLPEKEIHLASEKARHSICISDLSRASNIHTEKCPDDAIRTEDQEESDSALQHDYTKKTQGFMGCTYQTLATSSPETKEVLSIQNQDSIELKEEMKPSVVIDVDQVDTRTTESASIASAESCDCSSPTALSQHSSGEETYSGIFKSINVGIQELREQLKMLKMEDRDDICEDYSGTLSSDEFDSMNISTYQAMEEQLSMFKDEEDRDFSYVQDMLASMCDLPDHPEDRQVSSDVFLCLENKYSKLVLWSKSDRKLLFDLVNSILADMTIPDNGLHSKIMMKCWPEIDRGQLAENVWQMVQKQSNNGHFFLEDVQPLPLDHRSEVELVGMNIARIIHDDIIRDCIIEFMPQENYVVIN